MLQQFAMDLRLTKSKFALQLAIQLIAFVFGFAMVLLIMHVDRDPDSWFCVGTLMSALFFLIFELFASGFGYPQEFTVALSMGRTRKAFMLSFYLRMVLHLVVGWLLVVLLHRLELGLYSRIFPQYENEFYFAFLTNSFFLLPCFLLLPVMSMFLGALYAKYGKKGLFVFYFLWMFCCLVLPRMFHAEPSEGVLDRVAFGLMRVVQAVPVQIWAVFGAVTLIVMAASVIRFGLEQSVK